jgi:hypothetical protein
MMHLLLILEWLLRFYRFLRLNLSAFFLLGLFLGGSYCVFCSVDGILSWLSLAVLLLVLIFLLAGVSGSDLLVASLLKVYLVIFVVRHY